MMRWRSEAIWADRAPALALGLAVAIYGNATQLVDAAVGLPLSGTVGGGVLGAAALVLATRRPTWTTELGLTRRGLARNVLLGLLIGLLLGSPGLLAALAPATMTASATT